MADPLQALRTAYSRRDPRAEALRRELAGRLGGGPRYHELLCLVAEQAYHRGERCRAESLLRRAVMIADSLEPEPEPGGRSAARRLSSWIAEGMQLDPAIARASPPTCTVIEIAFTCALMGLDVATLDHAPMMTLDDRWLLVTAIASGGGKLAARCAVLLDGILAHLNRGLAAAVPYDPNYIGLRRVGARLVGGAELPALAAGLRRSAWSPSPLYVVDGRRFAPVTLAQLLELVAS